MAVTGAACGSSGSSSASKSPQDAVCSDASTLKASVEQLVSDVKKGNFGNAKDQVTKVQADFKALTTSTKSLATSKKSSVQSDLDTVKATLSGVTSAGSLADIQSTLKTAQSQITDSVDSLTNTLSC